jgi:ABC-type multidrug transport system permease subunit
MRKRRPSTTQAESEYGVLHISHFIQAVGGAFTLGFCTNITRYFLIEIYRSNVIYTKYRYYEIVYYTAYLH